MAELPHTADAIIAVVTRNAAEERVDTRERGTWFAGRCVRHAEP